MSQEIFFIFLAIFVLLLVAIVAPLRQRSKMRRDMAARFGKEPQKSYGLFHSKAYWQAYSTYNDTENVIDDLTWNGLDMDVIYTQINACNSSVGDAMLYTTLRCPLHGEKHIGTIEEIASVFTKNEALRRDVQMRLALLGRKYGGLEIPQFYPKALALRSRPLYIAMAFLPFVCVPLFFVNPKIGLVCLLASLVVNIVAAQIIKGKNESGYNTVRFLSATVGTSLALSKILRSSSSQMAETLNNVTLPFKAIGKSNTMLEIDRFLTEILMIPNPLSIFMLPILSYGKIVTRLSGLKESIAPLYEAVGEVDIAIALLSYRAYLSQWCHPAFCEESKVAFDEMYHPLLQAPVCNTAAFGNDVLITGSNASGKSTFIKTIAINCILAQTLNTCTAQHFTMKRGRVATSMAIEDNIFEGDSYFIAEIKSMKRLLRIAETGFSYFFIDEILKGTNTVERVAAAAELIAYLHEKSCICFAATHDIELVGILNSICENIHFREMVDDGGLWFDYKMQPGPSKTRNAILLLEMLGFPVEIYQKANKRAINMENERAQKYTHLQAPEPNCDIT